MNKKIRILTFIGILIAFGIAAIKPVSEYVERLIEENKWVDIRDAYVSIGSPIIVDPDSNNEVKDEQGNKVEVETREEPILYDRTPYEIPNLEIDFESLTKDRNEDIYAWIYIPDTKINYAVLQHPTKLDYYLNHNIDNSSGYPGCIYSQLITNKNFSDKNTVLYGHNMSNGTMFADLHKYEDYDFLKEHNYCFVYTAECVFVYQLFAGHMYDNAHQILNIDISNDEKYRRYLSSIVASAGAYAYDDSVGLTTESKLLTLSTCDDSGHDVRWLVQGVLIDKVYIRTAE